MMRVQTQKKTRWMILGLLVMIIGLCFMAKPANAANIKNKKPKFVAAKTAYINGKAVLTWKKVSGAKKYEVYRSTKKNKGYKKFATTKKLTISKAASNIYYYKVRAINGKQQSKFSNPVRLFSANAVITDVGFNSAQGLVLRVLVSNNTKSTMSFLGVTPGTVYLVEKASQKVVGKTSCYLNTSNDAYGISISLGRQIKAKKTQSLYWYTFDYRLYMAYSSSPSKYCFLITMPFYDSASAKSAFAIAAGQTAAESSVAAK